MIRKLRPFTLEEYGNDKLRIVETNETVETIEVAALDFLRILLPHQHPVLLPDGVDAPNGFVTEFGAGLCTIGQRPLTAGERAMMFEMLSLVRWKTKRMQ